MGARSMGSNSRVPCVMRAGHLVGIGARIWGRIGACLTGLAGGGRRCRLGAGLPWVCRRALHARTPRWCRSVEFPGRADIA